MTLQRSEASLCPTCGELMDGIVHGKSQCNLMRVEVPDWKDAEIARLHVEVESAHRLKDEMYAELSSANSTLMAEVDEALAQVVVLRRLIPHGPLDHDYVKDERRCDTCRILTDVPTEARALLDRLQRVEAVVKAFQPIYDGAKCRHCDGKILEHDRWCIVRLKAAWKEGT